MAKFKVGQKVFIPATGQQGIVTQVSKNGPHLLVESDGTVISITKDLVEAITIFQRLFKFFKSIFKKSNV